MSNNELINDSRLTPTMKRVRSGRTQIFREENKDDRSFIGLENCDLSLEHPNKEMYAELIDGQWYWVNGCGPCNGEERSYKTYIECDKHDVCKCCGISRKEIKGSVWGGSKGWTCKPCQESQELEIRIEAFKKFNETNHPDYEFTSNDKIICPHCGSEINSDDVHENEQIECYVCEGQIEVEVEWSASYSTSIIGKRITE